MSKRYIGDAVYVDCDGYYIILTTEDGISVTNRICLEPSTWRQLVAYVRELTGGHSAGQDDD